MDSLSQIANWATILSGLQQLPATVLAVKGLIKEPKQHAVVDDLVSQLAQLSDGFAVLAELKTFHDEAQILHNSFLKVHQQTSSLQRINPYYLREVWRTFYISDLPRFAKKVEGLRQVQQALPHEELADLQQHTEALHDVLRVSNLNDEELDLADAIDLADQITNRATAILTHADSILKQGIEDMAKSILQIERGGRHFG